ncbi:MAG: FAD-dependent thymidylate synthase [Patescibacteria group bacterium]|nr:FAD-dependent thymidylate synthase [Patescibacteria group bacterium]
MKIEAVKPKIWNFEIVKGEDAWKEVVYSARMSGVPPTVSGEDVFKMIIKNDYGSALEHIIVKFDIQMTKGNAPELLEHRMASHSGYSTRYIQADKGMEKKEPVYEIIIPIHLLSDQNQEFQRIFLEKIKQSIETYEKFINKGLPRESARYMLPFCQAVGIYHFTMNLRSLLNFLSLRLCVRTSPEMRCLAAQLYFNLMEKLPIIKGVVGCRGFTKGICPEANVTGVREGDSHPFYPICLFRSPDADIFIPTHKELKKGVKTRKFNKEKAVAAQENVFAKWRKWEEKVESS